MDSDCPRITLGAAPFNDTAADVILQSSDGVHFYVYKLVLSLASPLFKDMFSLPQSSQVDASSATIDLTEDSQTLDPLLRLCYPLKHQDIQQLATVGLVLEAAMKYQMEQPIAILRKRLRSSARDWPLQVFVITNRLQLRKESEEAAGVWVRSNNQCSYDYESNTQVLWRHTLAGSLADCPEKAQISAGALLRLLSYGRATNAPRRDTNGSSVPDPHSFNYDDADIVLRSSDGIEFRVHKLIICLASPNLVDKTFLSQDTISVITMPEDGRTIATLLEFCYPVGGPDLGDLYSLHTVLQAAIKYEMKKVIWLAKTLWMEQLKNNPLRVYCTAIRYGLKSDAQEAARCMVDQRIEAVYVPEMESISAIPYYRLLEYLYNCRSAIATINSKTRTASSTQDVRILTGLGTSYETSLNEAISKVQLEIELPHTFSYK